MNRFSHYKQLEVEPLHLIDRWQLGFKLGCVIKYIARAPHKGSERTDLLKAIDYLILLIAEKEEWKRWTTRAPDLVDPHTTKQYCTAWNLSQDLEAIMFEIAYPSTNSLNECISLLRKHLNSLESNRFTARDQEETPLTVE